MKICMKEMSKNEKGITIISLVITIIVMIIIATISINMGLSSINSTQDSAIETNLEIVQQAITQQYSKAMTLNNLDIESNINSNGGTESEENQPKSFLGTPLKKEEIKKYVEKFPQAPDLINVDNTYNYDDTNYEDIYYLISDSELEELGIDIGRGQEYIVNYSTGEVLDVTNQSYANGEPAYINSFTTILDVEKEDFVDTPINIAIHEEMKRTNEGYKFSIKVTDEIAKITPDGVAAGKNPTQADVEKDSDDLNKNDVIKENMIIIGKDPDNPITEGVSIVKKVVPDSSQGIGEHYIYEIIVDESKIDPTNPTLKIEILPDSVIDDEENGNAIAELTTSENRDYLPGDFDFYLDNIKYYAKNEDGEQIEGLTLGDETWGSSASVDITLYTTEKKGLNKDNYSFDYVWSTVESPNWEDAKQVTLNPRQGVKSVKTTIVVEGYTGKGKLYVKASTQFKTAIGTTYNSSLAKSVSLNLDCTPPIYKVEYKTADGTWRPLEEFLEDPNGYFTMSEPSNPGNTGPVEVSPNLKVTTMDSDAGLPQEDISENKVTGYYTYGIHTEEDLEKLLYEAKYGGIGDVSTVAYYSECYEAGWYPMEVKNGRVYEFPNELDFLASYNVKEEGSGEYILVCSKSWGYDGAYFIDCLGNKLEGNALYNNLKIDYFAPEVSKIELFEDGYGEFYITDDYSGIKLDNTKIKYAWIEDSSIPSNVEWKTITDDQIKQKQQSTSGGAYKRIGFKVDVPEAAVNYYLAVKLDNLEDIAGNKTNTEIVSEENIMKELFDFTLENLEYEIENNSVNTSGGFKLGDETWGKTATVDIVLKATGKNGLKANTTYVFEYYWTTDENYNWDTPENELNRTSIYVSGEGKESQSINIYLTDYTGEGYLYVRPDGNYESAAGTKLSKASKRIKVNLDNKAPEIEIYYKDKDGKEKPIEEFINKKDSFLTFQKRDPLGEFSYSIPNITYSFIDRESGLASHDREAFWSSHLFFDENHNPREIYGIYLNSEYSPTNWFVTSHSYQREDGYIIEDNVFKLYKNFHLVYSPDIPSGEYNLALTTHPRLLKEKKYLLDNCGNMINDIYTVGPIKIDTKAPEIVEITSDELGNPVIQINDDYSGLTKDYKKIKYAWVNSKDETPTTWSTDFTDIIEEDHTELNAPKTIYAKVNLPKFYEDLYLVVKLDGYKDVAGNQSDIEFTSDDTFSLAKDLKIEVFEDDGLERLKEVQIKITSESGKLFRLKKIWIEHEGLQEKHEIDIGEDNVSVFTEYLANYYSTVNGPIKVCVEDARGKVYEQTYTVKNVQGLILNYNISEKEFWLPIWRYTANLKTIDDQLIYVNWDKLNNNEEGKYVVQNLFDFEEVMVTIDDKEYERRELSFNPVKDVAIHEYSDTGNKQIEITGLFDDVYFNYDYTQIEIEHSYADLATIFTEESVEKIKHFYDKIETSRNSLKEIVQFGWQIGGVNNTSEYSKYKGESVKNFYNCKNLTTLPVVEDVEKDVNVRVFKDIKMLYFTFAGTGISTFDSKLLYKAENLHTLHGTFDKCKSFNYIDGNLLSNCPNLKICQETFRESALGSVPEELFWNNPVLESVQAAFDQTPLTVIPSLLFRWNPNLKNASYTFKMTLIESIPPNLFEWNGNLEDASYIFQYTEKLTGIPVELFQENENLETVRAAFEGSIKVDEIPETLFINNIKLKDVGYTFKKTSISVIPVNIFKLKDDIKGKIETVEGTFSYTKISTFSNDVFLPVKETVKNCAYLFQGCESLKIENNENLFKDFSQVTTFYGVFYACTSLDVIPNNLFSGCSSVIDFGAAFTRTPIKKVERNVIFGTDVACKNTVVSIAYMFQICTELKEVDNLFAGFSNLKNAKRLFTQCWELDKVSSAIFQGCISLENIGGTFFHCHALKELGYNAFDDFMYNNRSNIALTHDQKVKKVENGIKYERVEWYGIFQGCISLSEEQTPPLYKYVPHKVVLSDKSEYLNYNAYYDLGKAVNFKVEHRDAEYYEEEWVVVGYEEN